jgi:hypothetical protein
MAMAHDLANFGAIVNTKVCAKFEILEVKVPLSFFRHGALFVTRGQTLVEFRV